MSKTILWLASYPKSGNTWLRLFLFNYLFDPGQPAPINQAHRIGPSDVSAALYRPLAKNPSDLDDEHAVLALRPKVLAAHAGGGASVNFMKTHNANIAIAGAPLIPPKLTRGAVYVLRDPLDMAVSFAHHYAVDHGHVAQAIGSPSHKTPADGSVMAQYLGNWSDHVRSWTRKPAFPVHAIRYEDMLNDPHKTFGGVLSFIGAPPDEQRLDRAIRFSSFSEARSQEREHGFVEKVSTAKAFFRSGRSGEGRETLPESVIDRIVTDHAPVMKRHGYL